MLDAGPDVAIAVWSSEGGTCDVKSVAGVWRRLIRGPVGALGDGEGPAAAYIFRCWGVGKCDVKSVTGVRCCATRGPVGALGGGACLELRGRLFCAIAAGGGILTPLGRWKELSPGRSFSLKHFESPAFGTALRSSKSWKVRFF